MEEILPGIFHWTVTHERIHQPVSSYYVASSNTLIDPMVPPEGLEWFQLHGPPERIVLTNRHHWRHSGRLVSEFGCRVMCQRLGLHEFADGRAVEGFSFGDTLAEGISALEVDAICPEETALHLGDGGGALAFADGVVSIQGKRLGFVSNWLIGDDPEGVKAAIRKAVAAFLQLDFDSLLFAHGPPIVGQGKELLRSFAQEDT